MTNDEAAQAIRSNWPDERYTMLREALTVALAALAPEGATPAPDVITKEHAWHLHAYVVDHAADHDDDCPQDDTCDCSFSARNKAVSHVVKALVSRPAAAPAPAPGQCATCGERDGAHGDWCHTRACVNCGHGIAQHREGLAVRLLSDGHFHPCPGYEAEKGGTRCSFVHEEGWTCGRDQGHPSVHVPPSRIAPAPDTHDEKLARDAEPRYSQVQLDEATKPLHAEIERLKAAAAPAPAAGEAERLTAERDEARRLAEEYLTKLCDERARSASLISLARRCTNTFACVARAKRDHKVIAEWHAEIDALTPKGGA